MTVDSNGFGLVQGSLVADSHPENGGSVFLRNVLWTFPVRCKVCKNKVIIGTTKETKTCKAAVSWLVCQSAQQASDIIRLTSSGHVTQVS